MQFEREIDFFCRILQKYNIRTMRFDPLDKKDVSIELRRSVGMIVDDEATGKIEENTLYFVQDVFMCHYNALLLPSGEELVIGPYLTQDVSEYELMGILEMNELPMELLPTVRTRILSLPHLSSVESFLLGLLNALGETIWGSMDHFRIKHVEGRQLQKHIQAADPEEIDRSVEIANLEIMEARYEGEKRLMHAVSHGMLHQAQLLMSHITDAVLEQRTADPLRNAKNYGVVCNTLMRKAVEAGGVHPLHIDKLSDTLARQLEKLHTVDEVLGMYNKMVHKYCLLVKNHSMQGYSQLVQRVILRVETDLTADLSLAAHAAHLNVNPSYLSTLFKKEMGVTLTEYVNRQRVEHGIFLLNATDLLIQTIAQYCGMPDVNYFTKTFKKVTGKTPSEYRAAVVRRP